MIENRKRRQEKGAPAGGRGGGGRERGRETEYDLSKIQQPKMQATEKLVQISNNRCETNPFSSTAFMHRLDAFYENFAPDSIFPPTPAITSERYAAVFFGSVAHFSPCKRQITTEGGTFVIHFVCLSGAIRFKYCERSFDNG